MACCDQSWTSITVSLSGRCVVYVPDVATDADRGHLLIHRNRLHEFRSLIYELRWLYRVQCLGSSKICRSTQFISWAFKLQLVMQFIIEPYHVCGLAGYQLYFIVQLIIQFVGLILRVSGLFRCRQQLFSRYYCTYSHFLDFDDVRLKYFSQIMKLLINHFLWKFQMTTITKHDITIFTYSNNQGKYTYEKVTY